MDPQRPPHGPQQPYQQSQPPSGQPYGGPPYPRPQGQPPHGQPPYGQPPYGGPQQWQQFPAPWAPVAEPPVRRSSKRAWWIVGGSLAAAVIVALLAVVVVRSTQPQQQTAARPQLPAAAAPTTTTSAAPLPADSPVRCPQDDPGSNRCIPVAAHAFLAALPPLGYHCAPEQGEPDVTMCTKPKLVNYDVEFSTFLGGIDNVGFAGTVSGYVSVLKQNQQDAWNNTLQAMKTMLPIVFPDSPAMRSAVTDWVTARHGNMTGIPLSNPLPQHYTISCTDGSPIDIAGAHGTFRTYTYSCELGVTLE